MFFIKLNVLVLNPQRHIYDDSAVYSLSDPNAAIRTEVRLTVSLLHVGLQG